MTRRASEDIDDLFSEHLEENRRIAAGELTTTEEQKDGPEGQWYYEDGVYLLRRPDDSEAYSFGANSLGSARNVLDWIDHLSRKTVAVSDRELGQLIRLIQKVRGLHPSGFREFDADQ